MYSLSHKDTSESWKFGSLVRLVLKSRVKLVLQATKSSFKRKENSPSNDRKENEEREGLRWSSGEPLDTAVKDYLEDQRL